MHLNSAPGVLHNHVSDRSKASERFHAQLPRRLFLCPVGKPQTSSPFRSRDNDRLYIVKLITLHPIVLSTRGKLFNEKTVYDRFQRANGVSGTRNRLKYSLPNSCDENFTRVSWLRENISDLLAAQFSASHKGIARYKAVVPVPIAAEAASVICQLVISRIIWQAY